MGIATPDGIVKQDKSGLVSLPPPPHSHFCLRKSTRAGVRKIEIALFAQARKTVFNFTRYTTRKSIFKKFSGLRPEP